jgi:hypothetical protein
MYIISINSYLDNSSNKKAAQFERLSYNILIGYLDKLFFQKFGNNCEPFAVSYFDKV